jgi:ATP-dependent RNA helicase DeaD
MPDVTLEELPESLRDAVARQGWTNLMPVQAKTLPYLMAGRDMMVQARTGSGKTGAFLLPMLRRLDKTKNTCQALIMVPTRELARQVWQDAEALCGKAGFRTVAVYGGVGYGEQNAGLRAGAHIVVGTPGRMLDHLMRKTFTLDGLRMLVLDEADRMLSMGFFPDMMQVRYHMPDRKVNASLFSATFPALVMHAARQFIEEPEFISLSSDHIHVTDTEHVFITVPPMNKDRSLVRIIEAENPTSAIIFCNRKSNVHFVSVVLRRFGYDADELSSDLSQVSREQVLGRVRKGTLRFLVATDVAARGLDIPALSHVFLYEPPDDLEDYIHRAGRTGRAGASGVAISLVTVEEKFALDRIAKHYEIDLVERPMPSDEDVANLVAQRVTALLEAKLRSRDKLQTERSLRFAPLAQKLAQNEDESAIITMLLDDFYQEMLHGPPPQPIAPQPPRQRSRPPQRDRGDRSRRPRRGR